MKRFFFILNEKNIGIADCRGRKIEVTAETITQAWRRLKRYLESCYETKLTEEYRESCFKRYALQTNAGKAEISYAGFFNADKHGDALISY